jgi:hypothetical protein
VRVVILIGQPAGDPTPQRSCFMTTREDDAVPKHRASPSIPHTPTGPSQSPQPALSHVPRFALIHDIATGTRTHAPVTYLFADDPHPPMANNGLLRTLIVDLSPEADKVEQAQSLSGEWQIVGAKLGPPAKFASGDVADNVVLNVEGLGQFTPYTKGDDVFDLARQFSERYPLTFSPLMTRNEMIRRLIEKSKEVMQAA